MDSSSEESFAWKKCSSSSSGSEDSNEMNLSHNRKNEHKIRGEIMQEELQDSTDTKKRKKDKHKTESINSDEISPKKKKIKTEPGSDCDNTIKKSNKHIDITNGCKKASDRNSLLEKEYLNMLVKQEENYHESSNHEKNKKKLDQNDELNESIDNYEESKIRKEKKSKKKKKHTKNEIESGESFDHEQTSHLEEEEDLNYSETISPKKKKKKNKVNELHEFNNVEVETSVHKKKKHVVTESDVSNVNENDDLNNVSDIDMERSVNNNNSSNFEAQDYDNEIDNDDSNIKNKSVGAYKRLPKLSDRIKFEDEINADTQSISIMSETKSFLLKKFLKENSKLQVVSDLDHSLKDIEITDDDELWVLKCPHDIAIDELKHIDLNPDSKSKIKMNGETYCGNINDSMKMNIMALNKNGFKIKNVVPNGMINFRKRLPKPNIYEDIVKTINQTDFIPLPETKCRHPLFGSNYKDVIHVPLERLNPTVNGFDTSVSSDRKKKKKHKKGHDDKEIINQIKMEYDSEESINKASKAELTSDLPTKKSRKRKHSHNDEHVKKQKSKKIKLEPDSAAAWESEKTIEENLFNF